MAKIPYSHNNRGSLESSGKAIENRDGSTQDKAAPSAQFIQDNNFDDENFGLRWLTDGSQVQEVFCDFSFKGGGWTMIASNHGQDSSLPAGTSRLSQDYEVDRPGQSGNVFVGNGKTPSDDYLIGDLVNGISWSECLTVGWDRNNAGSGRGWSSVLDNTVDNWISAYWDAGGDLGGETSVSNVNQDTYNTSFDADAQWFTPDGIKRERVFDGTYDSNENQTTIGGTGYSNNEPENGTWFGHGTNEGSGHDGEGWHNSNGDALDSAGWATFVR